MWEKQSCELNFSVPFLDETKQPWYITYELWPCNSIRVHTASVFVLEGSFILVKGWNIAPSNLLSSMPFKQHMSSQTETKTFGSNNVWEENKDGGRRLTGHWSGKKKKKAGTLAMRKGLKISSPFTLGEEGGFQGSEIVKCYFLSISFEPHGNLKSHGYSSLVTIPFQNVFWNDFLKAPPQPPQKRLHSHTSWDSRHCAAWIPAYLHRWNWKGVFSSMPPHFFPQIHFTLYIRMRSSYPVLLISELLSVLISLPQHHGCFHTNYTHYINSSLHLVMIVSLGCIFMSLCLHALQLW